MTLALYRRFRPKVFGEVIGQDSIVTALTNQVAKGNIGHAYLFTGTRGTGKTSCAKILAKAVNCLSPINGSPCGECDACKSLSSENSMDIIEIDAASNNGVDEIRALRDSVKYPPINVRYKVYIIDEVHMLTDSAFNALLKTLEEPPAHVIFILATTEPYKLPKTILSRCARFDFKLVSKEDLISQVRKVFDAISVKYDEESLALIADAGEGSVRDTLSVADCVVAFSGDNITVDKTLEILGTSDKKSVNKLTDAIIDKDLGGVLSTIDEIVSSGTNLVALNKELITHFKDLLVIKTCKNYHKMLSVTKDNLEVMERQAASLDTAAMLAFMQKFSALDQSLKYALSPRNLVELACLECASFDMSKKN